MQSVNSIKELGILPDDRVFVVIPHPDDESVYAGGFLHMLAFENQLSVILLTKGEKSTLRNGFDNKIDLGDIRMKEFKNAMHILGVKAYETCDFGDGTLKDTYEEIHSFLEQKVIEVQPALLVTLEPSGIYGHTDHVATSTAMQQIKNDLDIPLLFITVLGDKYIPSAAARKMADSRHEFKPLRPEYQLNLSEKVAAIKLHAISQHHSQHVIDSTFVEKWENRGLLTSEYFAYAS